MGSLFYGREVLLNIRKGVTNILRGKLDGSIWNKLNELNIAKKTQRGCRGGKYKQRKIKTCISDRKSTPVKLARTVNYANLIKVRTQKTML